MGLSYFHLDLTVVGLCRGIVTADVLELGLSHGAIVARKLKGVKRDKEHGGYTGLAPYGEGKSLRPVEVVLLMVSMTRELDCYAWLSMRSYLSSNRRRVVPLYTQVDAPRLMESRPAHKSVRLGLSTILALHYKFYHNDGCNYGL